MQRYFVHFADPRARVANRRRVSTLARMSRTLLVVIASTLLGACAPVVWDLTKHRHNTMEGDLPPRAEPTEVHDVDAMIAAYQRAHPDRAVKQLYSTATSYRLVRHPNSGQVMRRIAPVIVAFEEKGACEYQQIQAWQEYGPDGWGMVSLHLPRNSVNVPREIYRDVPCDQLEPHASVGDLARDRERDRGDRGRR